VVLALLAEVCGPLAAEVEDRVRGLSVEQLEELAKSLLHFQSLTNLENWLDTHTTLPG
jgi:hypothetical protein